MDTGLIDLELDVISAVPSAGFAKTRILPPALNTAMLLNENALLAMISHR